MPLIRAQVTIPYTTALPEDVVTNTLYFVTPGTWPPSTLADLNFVVGDFYAALYAPAVNMPSYTNPGGAFVRYYDMAQPTPRVPIEMPLAWGTTPATTSTTIPRQASVVASFHAAPLAGASQASRRGRIYIGALTQSWITSTSPGPHIDDAQRLAVCNAMEALLSDAAAAGYTWVVYSEKLNTTADVAGGWVDNAIDTQRRRAIQTTERTIWP